MACKSFPLGCSHWVTDLSAVLTEFLFLFPSGWEIPASYPRGLSFSSLQFIFPFHLLRNSMSHFLKSRSHPLQAVLKANSLLPFSMLLLWCTRVVSAYKELQVEHCSLCSPEEWKEQSFFAHRSFIHSCCAPFATIPCFLKLDWGKWKREHFFFMFKKWVKPFGEQDNNLVCTFLWRHYTWALG